MKERALLQSHSHKSGPDSALNREEAGLVAGSKVFFCLFVVFRSFLSPPKCRQHLSARPSTQTICTTATGECGSMTAKRAPISSTLRP